AQIVTECLHTFTTHVAKNPKSKFMVGAWFRCMAASTDVGFSNFVGDECKDKQYMDLSLLVPAHAKSAQEKIVMHLGDILWRMQDTAAIVTISAGINDKLKCIDSDLAQVRVDSDEVMAGKGWFHQVMVEFCSHSEKTSARMKNTFRIIQGSTLQHGKAAADAVQLFKSSYMTEQSECTVEKLNAIQRMIDVGRSAISDGTLVDAWDAMIDIMETDVNVKRFAEVFGDAPSVTDTCSQMPPSPDTAAFVLSTPNEVATNFASVVLDLIRACLEHDGNYFQAAVNALLAGDTSADVFPVPPGEAAREGTAVISPMEVLDWLDGALQVARPFLPNDMWLSKAIGLTQGFAELFKPTDNLCDLAMNFGNATQRILQAAVQRIDDGDSECKFLQGFCDKVVGAQWKKYIVDFILDEIPKQEGVRGLDVLTTQLSNYEMFLSPDVQGIVKVLRAWGVVKDLASRAGQGKTCGYIELARAIDAMEKALAEEHGPATANRIADFKNSYDIVKQSWDASLSASHGNMMRASAFAKTFLDDNQRAKGAIEKWEFKDVPKLRGDSEGSPEDEAKGSSLQRYLGQLDMWRSQVVGAKGCTEWASPAQKAKLDEMESTMKSREDAVASACDLFGFMVLTSAINVKVDSSSLKKVLNYVHKSLSVPPERFPAALRDACDRYTKMVGCGAQATQAPTLPEPATTVVPMTKSKPKF
ncbi:unnamed protein product, partial [Prorocentrum cordatum]